MKIKKYLILTIIALLNFELNAVFNKNVSPIKECQQYLDAKTNRTWGDRITRTWQRTGKILFFECLQKHLLFKLFEVEEKCDIKTSAETGSCYSRDIKELVENVYFWLENFYPREHKQFIKEYHAYLLLTMKENYYGGINFQNRIIAPLEKLVVRPTGFSGESLIRDDLIKENELEINSFKEKLAQMEFNWINFQKVFFPYLYDLYDQNYELKTVLIKNLQKYLRCACIYFNRANRLTNGYTDAQLPSCEEIIDESSLEYDFRVKEFRHSDNKCINPAQYFGLTNSR